MTTNDSEALPRTADGRPWVDWRDVKREVSPEAAELARVELDAEVTAYRLAQIRKGLGRTQTDVAREMGIGQRRVSALESSDLAHTEVDTIARYVEALGGHVRLVADFQGQTVTIR